MGKANKPPAAKPSKPAKAKAGGKSSGVGLTALLGAAAVAALAWLAYETIGGGGVQPVAMTATKQQPGRKGKEKQMTPHELRQQGRMVPGSDRPPCKDAFGAGCSSMTAEDCGREDVKAKCCLSCFKKTCVDKDPECIPWAQKGQCYLNPEYMNATCCFACSPDPEDRCSPDPSKRPAVAEGDLSKVFERAVSNYSQYGPKILNRDPWVVYFENLLTPEETDGIFEAVGGKNQEYLKPSTTAQVVNGKLTDVPDQIRTSWNAWCQHPFCYNHPVHETVISRIMDIVGLPHDYAEHMQLLKYGPGEYYRLHHDWIPQQEQALCGPRVYTFFLYLSDVEEGGGTRFPHVKDADGNQLIVQPKRGAAVWWPHGMEHNLWQKDDRTHHEAMPVIKGLKKAANYWIHAMDFKSSMAAGCDGRQQLKPRIWRTGDRPSPRLRGQ